MSGAGKKVADGAFKAGKTIDWEGMAKLLVSDEARREFATLRRAFDDVNSQLQTKFSQEPQPIDWEYYRKGIESRLVEMYKQAYDVMDSQDGSVSVNNAKSNTSKGDPARNHGKQDPTNKANFICNYCGKVTRGACTV